jgi:L-ribulose-5-phosphate 3-epimerase
MQGRLSPPGARPQSFPHASWRDEFERARACGFEQIEWLLTAESLDDNPLWTGAGVQDMRRHSDRTGVLVRSVCADCFISRPLVRGDVPANVELLSSVIGRCREAGIAMVVVPILEAAALQDEADGERLIAALRDPIRAAESAGVRIALESDLPGAQQRAIVDACGSAALGANYDVGNAAAAGHDLAEDLRSLGSCLFGVHIKDRLHRGVSRPLGEGDVDFESLATGLARARYTGSLILETPVAADAVQSARGNLAYLRSRLTPQGAVS